jgi:hypothetical protein
MKKQITLFIWDHSSFWAWVIFARYRDLKFRDTITKNKKYTKFRNHFEGKLEQRPNKM